MAMGTESTRASYKSDFGKFRAWCAENELPPLPTSPEVLAHFIVANAVDVRLGQLFVQRLEELAAALAQKETLQRAVRGLVAVLDGLQQPLVQDLGVGLRSLSVRREIASIISSAVIPSVW